MINHESIQDRFYINDLNEVLWYEPFEIDRDTMSIKIDGIWYWWPYIEETYRYWPIEPKYRRSGKRPVTVGIHWHCRDQIWRIVFRKHNITECFGSSKSYDDAVMKRYDAEQTYGLPMNTNAFRYSMGVIGLSISPSMTLKNMKIPSPPKYGVSTEGTRQGYTPCLCSGGDMCRAFC